jgi:ATP-binding protein involved in chromosome partitioning
MSSIEGVTSVVAVGSCKGGVGKTTVSVNLALALRRMGSEVGLFDADLYGPNVPLMLGLRTKKSHEPFAFQNKATGKAVSFIPLYSKEERRYIEPIQKFGVHVMSLGLWFTEKYVARDSSFLANQLIAQVLADIKWPPLDYLIVDLPPGTGTLLQTIVARIGIDGMLLVTTPQDMTLLDSGRSLELFRSEGINVLGRIENMSYLLCPKCSERIEVFSTGYEDWTVLQDLDLLGAIPLNQRYATPVDAYHPFTQVDTHSRETEPFLEIAADVKNRLAEEN